MIDRLAETKRLISSLEPSGVTVASYVLDRHDAAIRILNPAHRPDGTVVTWREIGAKALEYRSDIQWADLGVDRRDGNLIEPQMGTVDGAVVAVLLRHLAVAGRSVYTAQWEGYADVDTDDTDERLLFPPQRPCLVRTSEPRELLQKTRVPMRWWDSTLDWVVGNDIYARSVFVSADAAKIAALLTEPDLEAFSVKPSDSVTPEDR